MSENIEYHSELNPKIWNDFKLKPGVGEKLKKIADAFIQFCEVPIKPKEYLLVGSIANYNWTSKSDIDIHIIVDLGKEQEFKQELFDSKKKMFKELVGVKIKGLEVEVSINPPSDKGVSEGVYSLDDDKWKVKPTYDPPEIDDKKVDKKVEVQKKIINKLTSDPKSTYNQLYDFKDKLGKDRKNDLKKEGEFGETNVAFKKLRKQGFIDKLKNVKYAKLRKELSMD